MKIGEFAERSGVSAKALRYYEDIGILRPAARTPSGYRLYDEDACRQLAFVRAAQGVGLRLSEIREVIAMRDRGEVPCGHVLELIHRRAAELDERISGMLALRDELARLVRRARDLDPRDCRPDRICHIIDGA